MFITYQLCGAVIIDEIYIFFISLHHFYHDKLKLLFNNTILFYLQLYPTIIKHLVPNKCLSTPKKIFN